MKRLLVLVAVCAISAPAFADSSRNLQIATRGGVVNSATVSQTAGAFAFSQVGQGERVLLESPRNDPLVVVESGAFIMPYVNDSFNASRGGEVRNYDPVGSYIDGDFSLTTNPIP